MAAVPSARKSIETIHELISSPPDKKSSHDNDLSFAIHHLSQQWAEIAKRPSLLTDVLEEAEEKTHLRPTRREETA